MNKDKEKTKMAIVASVAICVLLAVVYVVAFRETKMKIAENASITSELNDYLSRDGAINILKNVVRDTQDQRSQLASYFVSRNDVPDFAKKIEEIGKMSGVVLEIKKFKDEGNIFHFEISSKGSFQDTMHLIALMENVPFKVEFKKAYISASKIVDKEQSSATVWDGNFSIELVGFVGNNVKEFAN